MMIGRVHEYVSDCHEDKHGNTQVWAWLPKKAWLTYDESIFDRKRPNKTRRYRWVWRRYVYRRLWSYVDITGYAYYLEP
jgi:hypothetical protein